MANSTASTQISHYLFKTFQSVIIYSSIPKGNGNINHIKIYTYSTVMLPNRSNQGSTGNPANLKAGYRMSGEAGYRISGRIIGSILMSFEMGNNQRK
jgi:hypothetical protein